LKNKKVISFFLFKKGNLEIETSALLFWSEYHEKDLTHSSLRKIFAWTASTSFFKGQSPLYTPSKFDQSSEKSSLKKSGQSLDKPIN
jgi:hypothetical protein